MVTTLLAATIGQGPEFIGRGFGELLPVGSPLARERVDPKAVAGLLRIKSSGGAELYSNGVPPQSDAKHFLEQVSDGEEDHSLLAIPFATAEKFRDVTLHFRREKYHLRLPLAKAGPPAYPKDLTKRVGGIAVTVTALPWRFTTAPRLTKISARNESKEPVLIRARWVPQITKGPWLDNLMVNGDVRLFKGGQAAMMAIYRNEGARTLEIKALKLEAAPIMLAVSGGTSTVPLQYSLNGKLIYNRYHKLSEDCGFVALQVKNIYLSNFEIRNRPPGNLPSYTTSRPGDIVKAEGFRAKSKTPITSRFKIDGLLPKSGSQSDQPGTMVYITTR